MSRTTEIERVHIRQSSNKSRRSARIRYITGTFAVLLAAISCLIFSGASFAGKPEYELAYVNGRTVTINAIFVRNQNVPPSAQADFYFVVYPIGWETMNIGTPICNPCDHEGDGVDFIDFHDHVLDSMPADPGHGEFSPLWHVFLVIPNYNNDIGHDTLVNSIYASHIPAKSDAAVTSLVAARLPDGSPATMVVDTDFYFICSVVSANAGK